MADDYERGFRDAQRAAVEACEAEGRRLGGGYLPDLDPVGVAVKLKALISALTPPAIPADTLDARVRALAAKAGTELDALISQAGMLAWRCDFDAKRHAEDAAEHSSGHMEPREFYEREAKSEAGRAGRLTAVRDLLALCAEAGR